MSSKNRTTRYTLNWRGWSTIRRAQVIAVIVAIIVTIVIDITAVDIPSQHPVGRQPSGDDATALGNHEAFVLLSGLPLILVCKAIGCESFLAANEYTGKWLLLQCLVLTSNVAWYFALGTAVGYFLQKSDAKKGKSDL